MVVMERGCQAREDDADDADNAEGTAPRSSIFTFRGCACRTCGVLDVQYQTLISSMCGGVFSVSEFLTRDLVDTASEWTDKTL